MNTIKAVFVNVDKAEISHVQIDTRTFWLDIYKLCGWDCGDMVRLRRGNMAVVDDCGLMKNPKKGFTCDDYPQPLAGNAVIVGPEVEGETTDCDLTNEEIKSIIKIVSFGE